MDNLQRAIVSLMINGDDLVPAEVTVILGASPQLGVMKGEGLLAVYGKMIEAKTGMWQFGGDWESPPHLDRQISNILSALTDDISVWREITDRFYCYISIGGYLNDWTGGMTLAPDTLKLLSDRRLPIDFDLYAPDVSD